jgi:hypothetical protein
MVRKTPTLCRLKNKVSYKCDKCDINERIETIDAFVTCGYNNLYLKILYNLEGYQRLEGVW